MSSDPQNGGSAPVNVNTNSVGNSQVNLVLMVCANPEGCRLQIAPARSRAEAG